MADTSIKLSGTYDSIEAYNILEEMREMSTDYEEIKEEAEAAASAATAAVTTAQTAANNASTYATNAQTYAGNANSSAGEAAGYASNASTSATNAASSATDASNSAAAAATSKTNAAASASSAAASAAVVNGALPLSGGTMTGPLNFEADLSINASADNQSIDINGGTAWDKGAWMSVWGKDHATYPGYFALHANNGTNDSAFVGRPDGTVTWNNKPVMIKGVENGHGIQTGEVTGITVNAGSYKQGSVTFGTPFGGTPVVTATYSRGYAKMYVSIYSISRTGFNYTLTNGNNDQETGQSFTWIAIY